MSETGLHKADEVLFNFWKDSIKDLQKNLDKRKPKTGRDSNATYKLRQSILENLSKGYTTKDGYIRATIKLEDYYEQIDQGRGPTKKGGNGALYRNILQWVNDKGVNFTDDKGKKLPDKSIAYLITRKIHRQGFKGTKFFSKVINNKTLKKLESDLIDALGDDFEALILDNKFK